MTVTSQLTVSQSPISNNTGTGVERTARVELGLKVAGMSLLNRLRRKEKNCDTVFLWLFIAAEKFFSQESCDIVL